MHSLVVPDGLEVPCFNFQVSSMLGRPPFHHLQVGSMEDRWFLMHFLVVPDDLEVLHFKIQVSRMPGSPSRRPLSTISRLDPWRTEGS